MKHLLIILSILLLSSPVIGDNHKGEILYLWKTSSGEVWKEYGDKEYQDYYEGAWKNGKPNGLGVMIYNSIQETKDYMELVKRKYIGGWKDGKWNGQGIYKKDSILFVGEFRGDEFWEGTKYLLDGSILSKFRKGVDTKNKSMIEPSLLDLYPDLKK